MRVPCTCIDLNVTISPMLAISLKLISGRLDLSSISIHALGVLLELRIVICSERVSPTENGPCALSTRAVI